MEGWCRTGIGMAKSPVPGRKGGSSGGCVCGCGRSQWSLVDEGGDPLFSGIQPSPNIFRHAAQHEGSPVPRFNLLILTFLTERDRIARKEAIGTSIIGRTGCPLIKTNAFFVCSLFLTIWSFKTLSLLFQRTILNTTTSYTSQHTTRRRYFSSRSQPINCF
jgi:hypothetical protein